MRGQQQKPTVAGKFAITHILLLLPDLTSAALLRTTQQHAVLSAL